MEIKQGKLLVQTNSKRLLFKAKDGTIYNVRNGASSVPPMKGKRKFKPVPILRNGKDWHDWHSKTKFSANAKCFKVHCEVLLEAPHYNI